MHPSAVEERRAELTDFFLSSLDAERDDHKARSPKNSNASSANITDAGSDGSASTTTSAPKQTQEAKSKHTEDDQEQFFTVGA